MQAAWVVELGAGDSADPECGERMRNKKTDITVMGFFLNESQVRFPAARGYIAAIQFTNDILVTAANSEHEKSSWLSSGHCKLRLSHFPSKRPNRQARRSAR
jgi:hypothetical protein